MCKILVNGQQDAYEICKHLVFKPSLPNFLPPYFSLMTQGLKCKKGQMKILLEQHCKKPTYIYNVKVNNIPNSRKEWYCKKHKTKLCVYLRKKQK
jgi:hypothetical protein